MYILTLMAKILPSEKSFSISCVGNSLCRSVDPDIYLAFLNHDSRLRPLNSLFKLDVLEPEVIFFKVAATPA